jgi:putative ABC transport system permease protein
LNWIEPVTEGFLQDVRSAFRLIARRPGFTGISVFTLALGIGANTAIFSVVSAVMVGGLPFEDPDRLVQVVGTGAGETAQSGPISYRDYRVWAAESGVFDRVAAIDVGGVTLTSGDQAERLQAAFVSPSYFSLLGSWPPLGRLMIPEEDCLCPPVAMVSHSVWERHLAADSGAISRSIALNGVTVTVVGVMDGDFRGIGGDVGVWLPLLSAVEIRDDRPLTMFESRESRFLRVIARLEPEVTFAEAQIHTEVVAARLRGEAQRGAVLVRLEERLLGDVRGTAVFLLVAVGLVLLIACANVANLRIARDTARRKEIALRHALGASRSRMIRYLVTESVAVAVLGGVFGLIVALWLTELLAAMNPVELPDYIVIALSPSAVGFAAVLSLLTGVAFGVLPALQVTDARAAETLRSAARTVGYTAKSGDFLNARTAMVIGQVGLALVVLIAAGLMVRTLARQLRIDPGVDRTNLLTFSAQLPPRRYDPEDVRAFVERASERIAALPAVAGVAMTSALPLTGRHEGVTVVAGDPGSYKTWRINLHRVTPTYFATMGVPLLWGREFSPEDASSGDGVAIVSESLARQVWPEEDVVGKRIKLEGPDAKWHAVVGVVGDVKHRGLLQGGADGAAEPDVYVALYQYPLHRLDVAVRAQAEPALLAEVIRREFRWMDRDVAVFNLATFDELIGEEVAVSRLASMQLGSYGLLALILAAVGLYGVVSHTVTRRMSEISVRVALGASPTAVITLVLRQGMRVIVAGVAVGLVGAFVATKTIAHHLYGVSATDLPTYAAVTVVLTAVGLLACLVPARRATRVDPIKALKQE